MEYLGINYDMIVAVMIRICAYVCTLIHFGNALQSHDCHSPQCITCQWYDVLIQCSCLALSLSLSLSLSLYIYIYNVYIYIYIWYVL